MSFYSYKNANSTQCPCSASGSEILNGLNEKVCIQVQRVYDSCLYREQEIWKRQYSLFTSPVLSIRTLRRDWNRRSAKAGNLWRHCTN